MHGSRLQFLISTMVEIFIEFGRNYYIFQQLDAWMNQNVQFSPGRHLFNIDHSVGRPKDEFGSLKQSIYLFLDLNENSFLWPLFGTPFIGPYRCRVQWQVRNEIIY